MNSLRLPPHLQQHAAFSQVFSPNKLTFGLMAPFKGYPDTPQPDMSDHLELATIADSGGIAALWLRDVPFYDPQFGDAGQLYDPFVNLGYLAAATKRIALGTAGIISPLRNPVHTAKQAASVDKLSHGRLILGMSSGDRPVEYPAFGYDFENRGERFREAWQMIRTLTEQNFPACETQHHGTLSGEIDLLPKPHYSRLPMVTVGRARQDMNWFSSQSDAWIQHGVEPARARSIIRQLAEQEDSEIWHPFGFANFFELAENPNEPARLFGNNYLRSGSKALVEYWKQQEEDGVAHIILHMKPSRRPGKEVLLELIESVLPYFS